jgi:8-oxo-dGTP pyrophosphatase MutT (NUDIX family)
MNKTNYNDEDLASHHGVAAVIKDKKGKILMQEHLKYGFWTIPVGKVVSGQSIEEGLKQEIFEECNIKIKKFKEIRKKNYTYSRRGNKVIVFSHLFEIIGYTGVVKNKEPNKHRVQIFLSLPDIKKLPYLSDLTLLYLGTIGYKRKARIKVKI